MVSRRIFLKNGGLALVSLGFAQRVRSDPHAEEGRPRPVHAYGRWPGLAPEQRHEGRDLAITTDFRAVFNEVVRGHLGLQDTRRVFPGFTGSGTLGLF